MAERPPHLRPVAFVNLQGKSDKEIRKTVEELIDTVADEVEKRESRATKPE